MRCTEFKVSKEDAISRIAGLFAYIDIEDGNVHKATDSEMGCYAKFVDNIKCIVDSETNESLFEFQDPYVIVEEDETVHRKIFEREKTYSYRTLITYYYQYKNASFTVENESAETQTRYIDYDGKTQFLPIEEDSITIYAKDSKFIKFMERGMGVRKVSIYGNKDYPLVPEYMFIGSANVQYNEMKMLQKICKLYEENIDLTDFRKDICCYCDKFRKMGGTEFMAILEAFIKEADTIAEEYKGYVSDTHLTFDFDISLFNSVNDLGIVSPSFEEWMPYRTYYKNDKVFYEGKVWICVADSTSGKYNSETETVVFDDDSFKIYSYHMISRKTNDSEYNRFINDLENKYNSEPYKKITGITDTKLPSLRRVKNYTNDYGEFSTPSENYDWLFYYRKGMLVSAPRVVTNSFGNICKLQKVQKDNTSEIVILDENATNGSSLAAYGDYISDITYNTDENSITFEYYTDVHLKASISDEIRYDDDGNRLYFWENFTIDTDGQFSNFGVKHTEKYYYFEGSELDKLIKGEIVWDRIDIDGNPTQENITFQKYIEGEYDVYKGALTQKFEFIKDATKSNYALTIDTREVIVPTFLSNLEIDRKDIDDLIYTEIKQKYGMNRNDEELIWNKSDVENGNDKTLNLYDIVRNDYYIGISYTPYKDIDVHIDRGKASIFEKYIRFGEVKTLEDMEEFKNSSFFVMSDT